MCERCEQEEILEVWASAASKKKYQRTTCMPASAASKKKYQLHDIVGVGEGIKGARSRGTRANGQIDTVNKRILCTKHFSRNRYYEHVVK